MLDEYTGLAEDDKFGRWLTDEERDARGAAIKQECAELRDKGYSQCRYTEALEMIQARCPHKDSGSMFYFTCEFCGVIDA